MSGSLIETLMESERSANRSCAIAALWVAAVLAVICLIGMTGALGISHKWMYFYAGAVILPILAVVAYAKLRDFRGGEIKHLMILAASLVPAAIAVRPSDAQGRQVLRCVWHLVHQVQCDGV